MLEMCYLRFFFANFIKEIEYIYTVSKESKNKK